MSATRGADGADGPIPGRTHGEKNERSAPSAPDADAITEALAALGCSRPGWQADANCRDYGHLNFHATNKVEVARCLQVCGRCLVRAECLSWAMADPSLGGVLGGTDEAARRVMRRNRTKEDTRDAEA